MKFAMVAVPAAAVRRKGRHEEEMVNQLLFGEMVRALKEKKNGWARIRSLHDGYEGWVRNNLLHEISEKEAKAGSEYAAIEMINPVLTGGKIMQLPFGASLPGLINGVGRISDFVYEYRGRPVNRYEAPPGAEKVAELTRQWLNAPYLWGGRTIFGVDCSGFVQVNYKIMGIDLPRDAWQQAQYGQTVRKLKDATCGDLAFFDDKEEIVHVGILLNNEQIIHASGKVRIDSLDKKGIINTETGKRSHYLKSIKRYW